MPSKRTRPHQADITSMRLPLDERERLIRLAVRMRTSRSKILRAALAALETEPDEVIAARLAKLPPDLVPTYRPPALEEARAAEG